MISINAHLSEEERNDIGTETGECVSPVIVSEAGMVAGATCQRCKGPVSGELHGCPYRIEINDSTNAEYCNCCDRCRHECAMDI